MHNENKRKIEALVNHMVECNVAPAVSLAVVSKEETLMFYAGYKQVIPDKIENTQDAIFDLASISKVLVTTSLILKLMEDGLLSLKTKVKDVLAEFVHLDITVSHLITHTSGLPSDVINYKSMSKEEMIEAIYHVPLEYETGTKVLYSDVGFILLGFIIMKIKGDFESYAKEVLFSPLKMKDTGYNSSIEVLDRIVSTESSKDRGVIRGVVHDGKAFKLGGVSGNAGCFSTLSDMSNFAKMILNNGRFDGKQVLHPLSIRKLTTLYTEGLNEKRSLGWVLSDESYPIGDYASEKVIFHTGFTGPSVLIDFEKEIAVITLANRIHPSRENKKIIEFRNQIHNLTLLANTE